MKATKSAINARESRTKRARREHPPHAAAHDAALAAVVAQRGQPAEHACACGEQGEEWRLHDVERVEGVLRLEYSNHPEHYAAMCLPHALDDEMAIRDRIEERFGFR